MAFIRRRHPLPFEHMTQMAIASPTHNLHSLHAKRDIRLGANAPFVTLIERGPATAGLKLGLGRVDRVATPTAHKVALLGVEAIVLARAGALGTFLAENVELLPRQDLAPIVGGHRSTVLLRGHLARAGRARTGRRRRHAEARKRERHGRALRDERPYSVRSVAGEA